MNKGFNVEPGASPRCDAYTDVFQEVQRRLSTMSPNGKTFVELQRFAQTRARAITDSSETLQDDMRICNQAIIDGARAFLSADHHNRTAEFLDA